MRRINVLLLADKDAFHPWCEDVVQAIGDRHNLSIFDETQPLALQFDGVEVVIDHAGSVGTHEMMDAARDARHWQVMSTGFEHFDLDYINQRHPGGQLPRPVQQ
jgi:lactate dehydrogenase-like 2-hydroxyacid dehydrogenase